jgi:DnaJ-class molecular chaperone
LPSDDHLRELLGKIPKLSYFQILGLPHKWAKPGDVKRAFHAFATLYHPDQYATDVDETKETAREIFKRAVEAYEVLRDADLQKRYVERYLTKGKLRLPPNAFGKVDPEEQKAKKPPPPPPPPKTWIEEMATPDGREVAKRVEKMINGGKLTQALQQIGLLEQIEPKNPAVKKKEAELKRKMGVGK